MYPSGVFAGHFVELLEDIGTFAVIEALKSRLSRLLVSVHFGGLWGRPVECPGVGGVVFILHLASSPNRGLFKQTGMAFRCFSLVFSHLVHGMWEGGIATSNVWQVGKITARPVILLLSAFAITGCLPAAAPTSRELLASPGTEAFPFALVKIDARTAAALKQERASFGSRLKNASATKQTARVGDTIGSTICETGGSSLFPAASATPANFTTGSASNTFSVSSASVNTIPHQVVEADGTVAVPFAGRLKVAGLTPSQIGAKVEDELKQKAVAPQVVVSLGTGSSHTAAISGDVNAAKLVTLNPRGDRVLDVIAAAGGPKFAAYESYVHLVRHGRAETMLLQSIVANASENVIVHPGDQIYVNRNPRTYVVLGATLKPATFAFDRERITLAEAIAQAGGPIDSIGDISGIYLFRFESYSVARTLLSSDELASLVSGPSEYVPILYHLNLREAQGYFTAQAVQMRDKDVVLIANADGVQLQKLLAIVRGFTGIAYDLKRQVAY